MSVEKSLNIFGKTVIKRSRSSLTRKKKNSSKDLYNSLGYKLKVSKNSFTLSFLMEDYGKFIDKGVKGAGGKKKNGTRWKLKRVDNNTYKYRDKIPPSRVFNKWSVRKGLAPRDTKGKFTSRKSMQFALAKSVYHTGLETTNFFTKPFEDEFKKLPDDLITQYGLEVDKLFNSVINNNKIN